MASAPRATRGSRWALIAAAAGLFGLVTWRNATSSEPDYALHAGWAQELAETGRIDLPHPLFHVLTVVVRALLPQGLADLVRPGLAAAWAERSYLLAAVLVGTASYVGLALLLHRRILGERDGSQTIARAWGAAGWTLALMLVGPITVFTWRERQLYLGYIAPNVFHNPTMALLKPLALAWFWIVARPGREDGLRWVAAGLLACAATLAKPSFTVAFLPALTLWLVLARWLPQAVDRGAAIASLLGGGATLAFQAWAIRGHPALLEVAPLEVMGFYSAPWQMPAFFLLSIAFPLCLAITRWRALRRDGPLMLAWLVFAIGAAYGYLLAEAEPNRGDGNWLWSGQVALFILLAQTVLFLRSRNNGDTAPTKAGRRACALVFALHLACGLAWYTAEVLHSHEWWYPVSESED